MSQYYFHQCWVFESSNDSTTSKEISRKLLIKSNDFIAAIAQIK